MNEKEMKKRVNFFWDGMNSKGYLKKNSEITDFVHFMFADELWSQFEFYNYDKLEEQREEIQNYIYLMLQEGLLRIGEKNEA